MQVGRLSMMWYPSLWVLDCHRGPCCAFYLHIGPLEIMVVPRG